MQDIRQIISLTLRLSVSTAWSFSGALRRNLVRFYPCSVNRFIFANLLKLIICIFYFILYLCGKEIEP